MTPNSRDNGFMSDINVTPFVDVMLVLLIIFMVTAPMMMQGVDIDLPEATNESIGSEKEQLIITIDKENQVYINNFNVSIDFLQEKLIKILEGRVDSEVYLKADKDVSYGMVIQVMSLIKGAGIDKLGMVTDPDEFNKKNKRKT
ncbi:MAG: protein TolR [Desulfobacterales bacterium]|nr:protein TolR [Desulfobacterales bacterium]